MSQVRSRGRLDGAPFAATGWLIRGKPFAGSGKAVFISWRALASSWEWGGPSRVVVPNQARFRRYGTVWAFAIRDSNALPPGTALSYAIKIV